ncbi:MAG: hypothetical protein ACOC9R_02325, partial [bacterium]
GGAAGAGHAGVGAAAEDGVVKATIGTEVTDRGYTLQARGVVVHRERPWVAEITGHRGGDYARRFVRHQVDRRRANARETRGVWWWWVLESGRIYEMSLREDGRHRRRFVTVDGGGDIIDMSRGEVDAWLAGGRSGSTC